MSVIERCPGLYCGRTNITNETLSDCGACPRGFRVNELFLCQPCENDPSSYDWLYLGFMALLPLILHWFCIDLAAKERGYTLRIILSGKTCFNCRNFSSVSVKSKCSFI